MTAAARSGSEGPPASWRPVLARLAAGLDLRRPLTFLDLESTGLDVRRDRIVEVCLLRQEPGGGARWLHARVDPGRAIPEPATAVHGIGDADVAGAPAFREIVPDVLDLLRGTDLAGYNLCRFDLPLLEQELRRCGRRAPWGDAAIVDVWGVFARHERRDLSAAHRFYGAGELTAAHGAAQDVRATMEVLARQLDRYPDLPRDPSGLAAWSRSWRSSIPAWLRDGPDGPTLAFGRHRGRSLRWVARHDEDYLRAWRDSGAPPDVRRQLTATLEEHPGRAAEDP